MFTQFGWCVYDISYSLEGAVYIELYQHLNHMFKYNSEIVPGLMYGPHILFWCVLTNYLGQLVDMLDLL
jgi:hypothetical protein